jgi:hypothetical protein
MSLVFSVTSPLIFLFYYTLNSFSVVEKREVWRLMTVSPLNTQANEYCSWPKQTQQAVNMVCFLDSLCLCFTELTARGQAAPELRRLVSGFPPWRPGFKSGSGHVGFCDGRKWGWGRFSPRTSVVSPANLHSICFSTIIFTITRGWHNRPGVTECQ